MSSTRSIRSVAVAVVIALTAAACGGDDADDGDTDTSPVGTGSTVPSADDAPADDSDALGLDGSWVAIGGSIGDDAVTLSSLSPITLEITDAGDEAASVRGVAACNSYGGGASFGADGSLRLSEIAVTEMGCADADAMELEQTFVGSLSGLDRWELDDGVLVLSGSSASWRFEPAAADEPVPIVETRWVLDTYLEFGSASNSALFEKVTLQFGADETFVGNTGCTTIDGRWRAGDTPPVVVDYEALVDPAAGACSDEVDEIEQQVLAVLDQSPDINLGVDRLTLSADDGTALVFRAEAGDDSADGGEPAAAPEGRPSTVSVRPVLGCGEDSLTPEADIVQVDPARQLDCALGPPIADGPVFTADAEALPGPSGQWQVSVRIAAGAEEAWDAAATECFEQGPACPTGQLAIVANGAIASAPMVQTPTFPGEFVISGNFTQSDAESIAASINAAS